MVLLDIEMPDLDGIAALPLLLAKKRDLVVIMASTLTRRNAEISLKALSLGATDYIPKPAASRDVVVSTTFRRELIEKIRQLGLRAKRLRLAGKARARAPIADKRPGPTGRRTGAAESAASPLVLRPMPATPPRVLVIGASTGGPQALNAIISRIAPVLDRAPVLITQHMPPTFTAILAEHLARLAKRPAREARDGEAVNAGTIYVAPGARHMRVARREGTALIVLDDGPPINFCKPAVDPFVRLGRASLGRLGTRPDAHRHGRRRRARLAGRGFRRRQHPGAGRGDQRGLGHARPGRACRIVLGGAAARRHRGKARADLPGDRP